MGIYEVLAESNPNVIIHCAGNAGIQSSVEYPAYYFKIARIFSAYGSGLKRQIFWEMYRKYRKTGRLDLFGTGRESRDYIHVTVSPKTSCMAEKRTHVLIEHNVNIFGNTTHPLDYLERH